jgi:regulator of sigma E protease
MQSILAFVFVIGVLVFVHELGHFLAARRVGIRVLTFSLGFGPKLLKYQRGDTEYCVCALPLGGYVKMAGESLEDKRTGADDEFMSKSKWERFQVLIMGPVMNLVLAVVVMTFVLYQGAEVPDYEDAPPVIGTVVDGSAADGAGVEVGDRIVSVDGSAVATWRQVLVEALPQANQALSVEIRSETGQLQTVMMTPDSEATSMAAVLGVGPAMEPQIRSVTPGQPAAVAGVLAGDVIEALEGTPVSSEELVAFINGSPGESIEITVRRDGVRHSIEVVPALVGDVGLIGVALHPFVTRMIEPGFGEAFTLSLERRATPDH